MARPTGDDYDRHYVRALNGGSIDLSGVTEVIGPLDWQDKIEFQVDGADSSLDLSSLATTRTAAEDGYDGRVRIAASGGSTLSLPALIEMHNTWLDATGGSSIAGSSLSGTYSAKGLWYGDSYGQPERIQYLMTADGTGSNISLPGVAIVDCGFDSAGDDYDSHYVRALNGGSVDLSGVTEVIGPRDFQDKIEFQVDGADSSLDLSSLAVARTVGEYGYYADGWVNFVASSGATLAMPALTEIRNSDVTASDASTITALNLTTLRDIRFSATGGSTITGSSSAGTFDATGFHYGDSYSQPVREYYLVTADGAGSSVSLPGITTIDSGFNSTGDDYDRHYVRALNGGSVDLSSVARVYAPSDSQDKLVVQIDGVDSSVTLGDLRVMSGYRVEVDVRNGGDLDVAGLKSRRGTRLNVSVGDGSSVNDTGDLWLNSVSSVTFGANTSLSLGGHLRHRVASETSFEMVSTDVTLTGTAGTDQVIEVGGLDVSTAWFVLPDSNFAMGKLTIDSPVVRLMDIADNGNRGGSIEALYLNPEGALSGNGLTLTTGSVLVLNGLNVYTWDAGQLIHLNSLFGGSNEIAYSGGTIRLHEVGAQTGDVNFDGIVNAGDIDLMQQAIAGGSLHDFFDLDGDTGACDSDDRQALFDQLSTGFGDANLDSLVDAKDVGTIFSNWEEGAGWAQGDFDGDFIVDASDVGEILSNFTGDPGPVTPGTVAAEYDPATGEIVVTVSGVQNWRIEAADGSAVMIGPDDAAAVLPLSAGGLLTDNDLRVGESNFGGPFGYTDVNLGAVAISGLVQGDLIAKWETGFGQPTLTTEVTVIPEPMGVVLLGLGGLVLVRQRRAA